MCAMQKNLFITLLACKISFSEVVHAYIACQLTI